MDIDNTKTRNKTSIHLRLTNENKDALIEAKILGDYDSYEALIIDLLNGEATQKEAVNVDPDGHCLKALNELIKQSNNLNQLAKIANQTGRISDEKFEAFKAFNTKMIEVKKSLSKNVKILKGRL